MADIRLKVQKRAISGKGRARINTVLLTKLDIEEGADIDVIADGGRHVTVSAFADSMVDKDAIRVSPEDLKSLGIADGVTVIVKKAPTKTGQAKRAAQETADAVGKNISDAGKALKTKADATAKDTAKAAKKVTKDIGKAGKSLAADAKKKTGDLLKKKDL
ncbi:MAG: hypothetical protein ABFC24_12000 [Methanoregulaceae archaeon]